MASNDSSRPDDPPDGGGYVGDTPLPKAISWSASMTPELLGVVSRSLDANRTSDVLNYLLAVGKQNVEAVRHAYLQNNESYIIGAIHTPQRMLTWMDHNDWKSRCHGPDLEKNVLTVTIDAAAAKSTKFRAAFCFIFASGDLLENLDMRKTKLCLLVSIGTIKVLGSDFSKEQVQQLLTSDSVVKNEKISLRFISYVTALFCYPPLAAANGLLPAIEYLLESRLFDINDIFPYPHTNNHTPPPPATKYASIFWHVIAKHHKRKYFPVLRYIFSRRDFAVNGIGKVDAPTTLIEQEQDPLYFEPAPIHMLALCGKLPNDLFESFVQRPDVDVDLEERANGYTALECIILSTRYSSRTEEHKSRMAKLKILLKAGARTTGRFANGFTMEEYLVNVTLPHFTEETETAQTNEIIELLRSNRNEE